MNVYGGIVVAMDKRAGKMRVLLKWCHVQSFSDSI